MTGGAGDAKVRVNRAAAVGGRSIFKDKSKPDQIRESNIQAGKSIADAIRTSLGPRGMDKMIQSGAGEVTITNDGATILKELKVLHPCAKMMVELSQAQDVEAGDGTTSVVVVAGALLEASEKLLTKGLHPTIISECLQNVSEKAVEVLEDMAIPVDLKDRETLIRGAVTPLNSKVVSQHSDVLAPLAVDAVLKVINIETDKNVNLKDIKVVKQYGGTIEDAELVDGLVLEKRAQGPMDAPRRMEKAKIGLIQFHISPPKTDMEMNVVVSDYTQMDRILKEERAYLLNIVKQIKKSGCNVLLIQKSILRDAITDMGLHFLAKMKIMVVKDIEREDIEFISKTLGCRPIASLDHFQASALGTADLCEEVSVPGTGKMVRVTGIQNKGRTMTVLVRGSNKLVLDEAERSLHDALCVVRCLVKKRFLIPGGGAPEIELSRNLREYATGLTGAEHLCFTAFADALEVIPFTLAENAGLKPIETVTELRNRHAIGEKFAGINVKKGCITDIYKDNVIQPLLVTTSCIQLATETVRSILKIDDIVNIS